MILLQRRMGSSSKGQVFLSLFSVTRVDGVI